jgi:hypothetical protein
MKRRITVLTICFVILIAWTGLAFSQIAKPASMKTIKLSNGEEVFDISGEWDAIIENTGVWARYGTYQQIINITQDGSSFKGIRLKDNPPPSSGKAGEECIRGEVGKNGVKKLEWIGAIGQVLPSDANLSEGGSKIYIDAFGNLVNKDSSKMAKISLTRK